MSNFKPNLQRRSKWFKKQENIAEGDLVLVIDKGRQCSQWCIRMVTKVDPGTDGLVRSVQVQTSTGLYDHPRKKLSLFLSKEEKTS